MDSTVPTAQPLFPPRSAGIVPLTQRGKERSLTWPRLPPATWWSCWARQGRTGPSLLGGNWVCQNQVSGQELDRTRSLSLASLHCLPTPAGSKHLTKPHRPAEKGTLLPRGPAPPACAGANWNRNRPSSSGCPEKVLSPLQPCAPFPQGGLGAPAIIPRCSAAFQKPLTKCNKKKKTCLCLSVCKLWSPRRAGPLAGLRGGTASDPLFYPQSETCTALQIPSSALKGPDAQ